MQAPRDLKGWPHRDCSSQIRVRPHEWHVQQMGSGPVVLLLHGAGGSTHSFRDLMPLFAKTFTVVAVDLPGHGFTRLGSRHRSSLECVAQDLAALCTDQGWQPVCIIGHSAGAAVALRMSGLLNRTPRVVGLNPALQPFRGLAGVMFPVFARLIAMTPFMVDVALRSMAAPGRVISLLAGTGSHISPSGMNFYARLYRDRDHVDGTLLMMSQWKLDGLIADLPKITAETLFLTGSHDRTVPPITAVEAAVVMPHATAETLDGYGHLMHEEVPEKIAARTLDWLS